jgi:hypothetical protein
VNLTRFAIISLFILVAGAKAPACSVPVFRYALNYWQADEFELQSRTPKLPADISINLNVKSTSAGAAKLLLGDREIWSGELTADTLATLLDSPVRREIVSRILHGDSVVWVLVESGDAAKDDSVARALTERLRYLESIAVMPELRPDDPFNRLGPGPALAIRHSVIRLSRKDPRESFTLAMLDHDGKDASSPIAYPVFGRGRVLIALPQEKLTTDNIDEVCGFLTSACSCEVKDKRMGWDLMLQCDWEEELGRAEQQRRAGPVASSATSRPVGQSAMKPETVTIAAQLPVSVPRQSLPWFAKKPKMVGSLLFLVAVVSVIWIRKRA